MSHTALANPVWHALTGPHLHLSQGSGPAHRYHPEVSPFLGVESPAGLLHIAELVTPGDYGLIMADFDVPEAPPGFTITQRAVALQMIARDVTRVEPPAPLLDLGAEDGPEMLELADLTRPGPFGPQTWRMGPFKGIRDGRRLIAMTGHRLHLPDHTEISGVCTHPDHLGHGYARALVSHLTHRILESGKTPFLQVLPDNHGAISVYRKLGFTDHALLNITVLMRDNEPAGLDKSPRPRDS